MRQRTLGHLSKGFQDGECLWGIIFGLNVKNAKLWHGSDQFLEANPGWQPQLEVSKWMRLSFMGLFFFQMLAHHDLKHFKIKLAIHIG